MTNQLIEEIYQKKRKEFIHEYCNDHQKLRFLRSVFFDDEECIETFMEILKTSLNEVVEATLQEYNEFIIKEGYADDDLWQELPTAIERFKKIINKEPKK